MKWEGNRQSDNVEDHRGGGGGGGFGFGGRSIGIGTIVLALIGSAVFGVNPLTMLNLLSGGGAPAIAGALRGLGFHLANRLFQRQPLAGDFGLAQGRLHAPQLRNQRGAGPLIKRASALAGSIGVQSGNSAGDQRVVISHFY